MCNFTKEILPILFPFLPAHTHTHICYHRPCVSDYSEASAACQHTSTDWKSKTNDPAPANQEQEEWMHSSSVCVGFIRWEKYFTFHFKTLQTLCLFGNILIDVWIHRHTKRRKKISSPFFSFYPHFLAQMRRRNLLLSFCECELSIHYLAYFFPAVKFIPRSHF